MSVVIREGIKPTLEVLKLKSIDIFKKVEDKL
jgi:hypothetical protein